MAVLDDVVDISHPDLAGNIWVNPKEIPGNGVNDDGNEKVDDVHGWDFVDDKDSVIPYPWDAHGMACAGLVAATGNNGIGVVGVAWNCRIMPICIVHGYGWATDEDIATAIRYAAKSGADVLSNSWHGSPMPVIHSAIKDVTALNGIGRNGKGCIVLAASGNVDPSTYSDRGVMYPAAYSEVIAVGATDPEGEVCDYSFGGAELDIVAPGGGVGDKGDICTTDLLAEHGYSSHNHDADLDKNYTDTFAGTSAACPIAAGVAALVLSIDPNLTNREVRRVLLRSASDLGPQGRDEQYGFGQVDAHAAVALALNPPPPGVTMFVDDNAPNDPGPGNASVSDPNEDGSLDHPFDTIQEAIEAANTIAVVVLPGTYTGAGNRDIDFNARDITVRSKDGPGSCIIDCRRSGRGFYFHSGEGADSVLEGLTIANGYVGWPYQDGGAVYNSHSSPTFVNCRFIGSSVGGWKYGGGIYNTHSNPAFVNCTFTGNSADGLGGGMYNSVSSPTFVNCTFTGNSAGSDGGGMYNSGGSPTFVSCTFTDNSAGFEGGGMYNSASSATFVNCMFTGNSARNEGGGMYNQGNGLKVANSSPTWTNCIFMANSAKLGGGGMFNTWSISSRLTNCRFTDNATQGNGGAMANDRSSPTLTNCTLDGNLAANGRALACDSYQQKYPSDIKLVNCILWNGGNEICNNDRSIITISYSDVDGGWPGEGNLQADPLFADPNSGDYHLRSQAGRWDPTTQSWVLDDITSPCIDAGDPNTPIGDEPSPNGLSINMGNYGGTSEASLSVAGQSGTPKGPAGLVLVDVPGGTFQMGDHDGVGDDDEMPVHAVTLDTFRMSTYETTNAQYCQYLNAAMADGLIKVVNGVVFASSDGGRTQPYCSTHSAAFDGAIKYSEGWFAVPNVAGFPLHHVSWYGAKAYCDYYGFRLPTEAEWEYAARGGYHDPYCQYSWGGNVVDCSKANFRCDAFTTWGDTSPVGYYGPQGAYGLCDMSGNVWEWCQDWYDSGYYSRSPVADPTGPPYGQDRVLRGGSCCEYPRYCRCSYRGGHSPDTRDRDIGFRIVLDSE